MRYSVHDIHGRKKELEDSLARRGVAPSKCPRGCCYAPSQEHSLEFCSCGGGFSYNEAGEKVSQCIRFRPMLYGIIDHFRPKRGNL